MDLRQIHGIITPASWPQGPAWGPMKKSREKEHISADARVNKNATHGPAAPWNIPPHLLMGAVMADPGIDNDSVSPTGLL